MATAALTWARCSGVALAADSWMALPSNGSVCEMPSLLPNPDPNFVLGVVYAVIELDNTLHRENREFGACQVAPRPDGRADVTYRAAFLLPPRGSRNR